MELDLQFSDDDLAVEASSERPKASAIDYTPKFEEPKWYFDSTRLTSPEEDLQMMEYFQANKLCVEGRYEDALSIYSRLLSRNTRNSTGTREVLDSCARCLLQLDRPAEAAPLLERSRALLLNRDHQLVWSRLAADVHDRLGQPETSLPLRQAAVTFDPVSPLGWLSLAETYGLLEGSEGGRRLRVAALLWARAALDETGRAARSFVADAARARLREVDAALAGAASVSDDLPARLRQRLLTGAPRLDHQEATEDFVDRGSSKYQEKVESVEWGVSREEFERKWFEWFIDEVELSP